MQRMHLIIFLLLNEFYALVCMQWCRSVSPKDLTDKILYSLAKKKKFCFIYFIVSTCKKFKAKSRKYRGIFNTSDRVFSEMALDGWLLRKLLSYISGLHQWNNQKLCNPQYFSLDMDMNIKYRNCSLLLSFPSYTMYTHNLRTSTGQSPRRTGSSTYSIVGIGSYIGPFR